MGRRKKTVEIEEIPEWKEIEEFPEYSVSNTGLVRNDHTTRILNQSFNQQGVVKVGLFDGKKQHTRSVKFLVAVAFVEGRTNVFDTAINLDGDQEHNHARNIAWRPRWFAMRYSRQFDDVGDWYLNRQIYDTETELLYGDMVDAAIEHGILLKDILMSTHEPQHNTFPTGQKFGFYL